jgi:integrase
MFEALLDPDQDHPLSVTTVHRVHATLHCALNGAVKQGLIQRNPASLVELPAVIRARTAPWSAGELATFLNSTVDDPMHALFALLGLRGLRRGEALGLRWRSVDLDQRTVLVEEQLNFYNGVVVIGPPKSKSGRRLVAIDETLAETLQQHALRQSQTARTKGWTVEDYTCVFSDEHGEPLKPVWVTRRFYTLVREHKLRRIRLHDLRHTSASIGLASGETLLEVSRRLGHSSVAITADIYSDIAGETAQASAERMAAHLRHQ